MKFQNLRSIRLLFMILISLFFVKTADAFEESSVQRSIREVLKSNPEVGKFVDEAMKLFRDQEKCGSSAASARPEGSKKCTDLFSYDKAEAASAADLKACEAKCTAGAAGAKPANGKGNVAELAKCVEQACKDECSRKELIFKLNLDSYLKGSMKESAEFNEFLSKRGATIWMNK
jgi:hypothetical protein